MAPGNKLVLPLSPQKGKPAVWNRLAVTYPPLSQVNGVGRLARQQLMTMSGTSIAAPTVAGTVALMFQANPGLTAPLVKAILQYTAQPLPGASLAEQGTGPLDVEGGVRLAAALRTDIPPR